MQSQYIPLQQMSPLPKLINTSINRFAILQYSHPTYNSLSRHINKLIYRPNLENQPFMTAYCKWSSSAGSVPIQVSFPSFPNTP